MKIVGDPLRITCIDYLVSFKAINGEVIGECNDEVVAGLDAPQVIMLVGWLEAMKSRVLKLAAITQEEHADG